MILPARLAERSFACFGGRAHVLVEGTSTEGRVAALAALLAQAQLHDVHRRLSRFDAGSELSRLNGDPAAVVAASRLLRRLAAAVVEAGVRSGGLVDATRLRALERTGYTGSRAGEPGLTMAEVVAGAPAPGPAGPHRDRPWATIVVDDLARSIARPPGLRIDGGGLVKGLAADLLATTLAGHPAFAIDCAGDVRVGGRAGRRRTVLVEDPFDPDAPPVHALRLRAGAAATSGVGRRSWPDRDGAPAHHLIDPATGRPAWTGVVQATAFAPTALEAEILAKTALLSGPERGRDALEHGGVLVLADRTVDVVEARVRVRQLA